MEPRINYQRHSPSIALVALNRPASRNALTIALMQTLVEKLDALESDPTCRCMILTGEGSAFCTGLDLNEAADLSVAEESAEWVARTLHRVATTSLVTIAAAHGAAFAGGAGLMSACDLVVAARNLQVGFPEVRRGLVPAIVSHVLRDRLRCSEMRELFLLAEPIEVSRARSLGLVHRIVSRDDLLDEAITMAETVCKGAPEAVRQTKAMIRQACSDMATNSLDEIMNIHNNARTSHEAVEGLAAFREKRDPAW